MRYKSVASISPAVTPTSPATLGPTCHTPAGRGSSHSRGSGPPAATADPGQGQTTPAGGSPDRRARWPVSGRPPAETRGGSPHLREDERLTRPNDFIFMFMNIHPMQDIISIPISQNCRSPSLTASPPRTWRASRKLQVKD